MAQPPAVRQHAAVEHREPADGHSDSPWWRSIIAIFDAHNGAFNAIFSGLVACFTLLLFFVGRDQHQAAMGALRLARDEFISTHRPRIIMRDVSLVGEEGSQEIVYSLVNSGGTMATLVQSWFLIEFVTPRTQPRNLRSAGHNDLGQVTFAVGEAKEFNHAVGIGDALHMRLVAKGSGVLALIDGGGVFFTGSVLYIDDAGNNRRSVFRRRYAPETASFYRMNNPDLEYAD